MSVTFWPAQVLDLSKRVRRVQRVDDASTSVSGTDSTFKRPVRGYKSGLAGRRKQGGPSNSNHSARIDGSGESHFGRPGADILAA